VQQFAVDNAARVAFGMCPEFAIIHFEHKHFYSFFPSSSYQAELLIKENSIT
jgi:hypothetical protein